MINRMKFIRLAVLVLISLPLFTGAVFAQQSGKPKAITIEPFLQEVILEPNDASKTFTVQVTNNTNSDFRFSLSAVDFGSLNESGGIFFTGTESVKLADKYGLAKWIDIGQTEMELAPGQKAQANITLLNRNDLSPGGHYGAIFINSGGPGAADNPSVSFRQSISALVLAIKRGGEKYDLGLDSIKSNGSLFKAPTEVNLRFKNTGNTHVVPRGIVYLKNNKDTVYAKGVINENSSYILPETFRVIPVELKSQKNHPFHLVHSRQIKVDYRYDGLDVFATKTVTARWINLPFLGALAAFLAGLLLAVNYFFGEDIEKFMKKNGKKGIFKKLISRLRPKK